MVQCLFSEELDVGWAAVAFTKNFRFPPCFEQRVLDIHTTIECGLTLKGVPDMIKTYSQRYRTEKYSELSPIL